MDPEALLEALTRRALEAAEDGRWEDVAACYRERAELIALVRTPAIAARVIALDQRVAERIHLAQAALRQVLADWEAGDNQVAGIRRVTANGSAACGAHLDQEA
jgi:hypothetical protein